MSDRMPTNYTSLADKSVFITGGATGIGEALVSAFVEQGEIRVCGPTQQVLGEPEDERLRKYLGR